MYCEVKRGGGDTVRLWAGHDEGCACLALSQGPGLSLRCAIDRRNEGVGPSNADEESVDAKCRMG
jgi:hypothetical protein